MFSISRETEFRGVYTASVTIREKHYEWDRYCCRRNSEGRCTRRCYDCEYDYTTYDTDTVTVEDTITVIPYEAPEEPSFSFLYTYNGNYQGIKTNTDNNLEIDFPVLFPPSLSFHVHDIAYHPGLHYTNHAVVQPDPIVALRH
jgi:hypothetical protein